MPFRKSSLLACCMRQRQRVESRASTPAEYVHRIAIAPATTTNTQHSTHAHAQKKEAEWLRPKNPAPAPTRSTSRSIWSACR